MKHLLKPPRSGGYTWYKRNCFLMKNLSPFLIALLCFLMACQNSEQSPVVEVSKDQTAAAPPPPPGEPSAGQPLASAVSRVQGIDTAKQLIRTAQIKFRAPKVLDAALEVERIAQQNGGFVLQNEYRENSTVAYTVRVSKDSAQQVSDVAPTCQVIIRVPFHRLDTTLRAVGRLAEVIDYRDLQARDVSLDLMEQQLNELQHRNYGAAVSGDIAANGQRLQDITAAREREFNAKRGEDIARIERLRIEDQVRFSTVTIAVYELAHRRTTTVVYTEWTKDPWRPGLFSRIGDALASGLDLLYSIIVGLSAIWPLLVIAAVVVWFLKRKK